MLTIVHRVNSIEDLMDVPVQYGVEVDIRADGGKLILNHEPHQHGDTLDEYLKNFRHAYAVLELKEESIEDEVIGLCRKHGVKDYFLLSVSFPYLLSLSNKGVRQMAVRFSEHEDINTTLSLRGKVDWVWVDTFTKNPLTPDTNSALRDAGFNICLVCPERWGRPQDIMPYKEYYRANGITLDAVMTSLSHAKEWNA